MGTSACQTDTSNSVPRVNINKRIGKAWWECGVRVGDGDGGGGGVANSRDCQVAVRVGGAVSSL